MMRREEGKRLKTRFPYKCCMSYQVMGNVVSHPEKTFASGEILDLSESGLKIGIEGRSLKKGSVLMVKVPLPGMEVSVPALAEVRWTKEENTGACCAGLQFIMQ